MMEEYESDNDEYGPIIPLKLPYNSDSDMEEEYDTNDYKSLPNLIKK